ncbi:MAG: LysM peptidoglycan-binding domain-containing protein [Elusimicrobiota bacterium]
MGTAYTAVSDDANAMNTNPAGLAQLKSPELTAVYGKLYTGLSDESKLGQGYFGVAAPVQRYAPGVVGLSWDEVRLSEAYSETVFTVSYATAVYRGIYGGMSLKYLKQGYIADPYTETDPLFANKGYSKSGVALDLGALYRLNSRYSFAVAVKNLNQPDMGLGTEDRVHRDVKLGAAYWLKNGVVDTDVSFRDGNCDFSVGAERAFQAKYLVRLGFLAGNDSRRNISLGFGTRFGALNFDYAFTLPIGGISGTTGSHRLAFGFKFGAEAAAEKEALDVRTATDQLAAQERKIAALEEALKARTEAAKAPAVPAVAVQPAASTEAVKAAEPQTAPVTVPEVDQLKLELERSRKEAEGLKDKLVNFEEKGRKKEAAPAKGSDLGVKVYVVRAGDTLETIAAKVYGDASKWPQIYKANPAAVGRGGEVKAGQALVIP